MNNELGLAPSRFRAASDKPHTPSMESLHKAMLKVEPHHICHSYSDSLHCRYLRNSTLSLSLFSAGALTVRRKMKHSWLPSAVLLLLSTLTLAQQPSAPATTHPTAAPNPAPSHTAGSPAIKHPPSPTLPPEPGGTVVYEWGIPVEVFQDGHRKPLWRGNADTAKSARSYSSDSPEVRILPSAPPKPDSTTTQKPIPPDTPAVDGNGDDAKPTGKPQNPAPGAPPANPPRTQDAPTGNSPQPQ